MTSNRFKNLDIQAVTLENAHEVLPDSLYQQAVGFFPPEGSFDTPILRRYLESVFNYEQEDANSGMTLANRLRLAFKDMSPDTICGKFPQAELPLKRRLRCVAEYLIRSGEFDKLRDENGKLVKKRGNLGKLVVIYKPLPKLIESLDKQGLLANEPT
jgi:peptidoglycan/xylan/chitin deacetylase (PgdA/CDA1 family)